MSAIEVGGGGGEEVVDEGDVDIDAKESEDWSDSFIN